MTHTYSGSTTIYPANITLCDDGDVDNATLRNTPLEGLANRTNYLNDRKFQNVEYKIDATSEIDYTSGNWGACDIALFDGVMLNYNDTIFIQTQFRIVSTNSTNTVHIMHANKENSTTFNNLQIPLELTANTDYKLLNVNCFYKCNVVGGSEYNLYIRFANLSGGATSHHIYGPLLSVYQITKY